MICPSCAEPKIDGPKVEGYVYLLSCTSFTKAVTQGSDCSPSRDAFERGKAKVVDKKEPCVCVLQRLRHTVHVLHYREMGHERIHYVQVSRSRGEEEEEGSPKHTVSVSAVSY